MIRRRVESSFFLVTQAQLAEKAIELLPLLGGEFAPVANALQVTAAMQLQAAGLAEFDVSPMLDAAGRPMQNTELPVNAALLAWSTASAAAEEQEPYAALLVSLLSLQCSSRLDTTNLGMRDIFEINKHQHREIEQQERLRPKVDLRNDVPMRFGLPDASAELTAAEQSFFRDYHVMFFLLSLTSELALHHRVFAALPGLPKQPGTAALTPVLKWTDGNIITLSPWPFTATDLQVQFAGKLIPSRTYDHERELHAAYQSARDYTLSVPLRPGAPQA
jgi:hypothetical protein